MFKKIIAVLAAAAITVGMLGVSAKAEETSEPLRVMPLGDSITDGFNIVGGYRTTLWRQLEANGYTSEDIDLVGPNWGGDGDPNHAGYSGYSIADIPGQRSGIYNFIDWLMENHPADVVLLQIGTNDILSSYELDTMGDRLELLVDAVLSYLPEDGLLYVATIPYMDADVTTYTDAYTAEEMDEAVDNYNADVRALVEKKQAEGKQIALSDINAQLTKSDLADGVHPNEEGYAKMGNYWYGKLEAYLNGSSELGTTEAPEPSTEPTTILVEPLIGDANGDGVISVLDVVHLTKYLLKATDTINFEGADVYPDAMIDVFDLGMLKRIVMRQ